MNAFVAITDNDWYRHLAGLPDLDEVNFWRPSGKSFGALQPGEVLLFKLHAPENYIVGGGFFAHFTVYPASLAWEAFGEKNGASTYDEMRSRIEKYRKVPPDSAPDYDIGCIVLEQPFFFDRNDWFPPPQDFESSIQVGKLYDMSRNQDLWEAVQMRILAKDSDASERPPAEMFGEPRLVKPRLGQGAFRLLVTDTYQRRCAITREKVLPVLQAAHIRPVATGGEHRIDNGLLLRSDIHTLFDKGYVTVTPVYKMRVSRRLRDDFNNGEMYNKLDRSEIWLPPGAADRPSREGLEWHADTVFRR